MTRRLFFALLLGVAAVLSSQPELAHAQANSPISAQDRQQAIGHYRKGRQLFAVRKYQQALEQFDKALALMPSPNTELVRAHTLRELGRKTEAMASYEAVMKEASDRVGLGQTRYQPALDDATRWRKRLRPELAELNVVVRNAPGEVTVQVDGDLLAVEPPSGVEALIRAHAWRQPGAATVTVSSGDAAAQSREVELVAGKAEEVEFELASPEPEAGAGAPAESAPAPPPPPGAESEFAAPPVPAWIAAGVGVVGFGLFAVFGALSSSTASDLDECAPQCPDSLREDADAGKTQQTVANVGLIVGATGMVAAGTIWLVDALTAESPAEEGDGPDETEPEVALGVGSVWLRGRF